ncbi:MAG: thiamine pyrophosphate-dependent enzyme, partial [Candidatus Spechtbacterales bacterium]
MTTIDRDIRLKRYRALAKVRALHETIVVNLGQLHGAVLTGLGNEAAPVGMALAYGESMAPMDFLLSPKGGDQRSQMAIAAVSDIFIESEHDHSYMLMHNHLQRKGVEDGNVHWGCFEHGIWPFYTSDMMALVDLITGGSWRARKYARNAVGLYLFGEGASSQGVLHEVNTWLSAQNCVRTGKQLERYKGPLSERAKESGVLRPVPVNFGLQINRWAIYTDTLDEHGGRDVIGPSGKSNFAIWAESYGMRGIDLDGDDLEAVINATKEAVHFAQQDRPIPTLMMLHMETRRTAHNEHMIARPPEARKNRDWSRGKIEGVDPKVFAKAWEEGREPLTRYRNFLVDLGVASTKELDAIFDGEREVMGERWARAQKEPPATFSDAITKRAREHFMFAPHKWSLPHMERPLDKMQSGITTTTQAFIDVMSEILEEDDDVVYSGEDVGSGGVLVATRELQEKFGSERVFDTPISEIAILGTSAGASIEQWILAWHGITKNIGTPFCEAQFMDFGGVWLQRMRSLSPNYYQKSMPHHFVAICHYGVVHGGGSGEYHSNHRAFDYMGMPGIAIVSVSDAFDLVGLMRAAYEARWPVVFMVPIWSYGERECAAEIPKEKYLIPIGKAAV